MENLALKMTLMEAVASGSILQKDRQAIETLIDKENTEEALDILNKRRNSWSEIVSSESSTYLKGVNEAHKTNNTALEATLKKAVISSGHVMEILRLEKQLRIKQVGR